MDEIEARSLFMAFHLEKNNYSPQVLAFGAHMMRVQVVSNGIKSICIWHRWKWKKYTRKHNKQCSCGALSKDKLTGVVKVNVIRIIGTMIGNKDSLSRLILVVQNRVTNRALKAMDLFSFKVEVFQITELLINITKHALKPKHRVLTDEEKKKLLKKFSLEEIPVLPFGAHVMRVQVVSNEIKSICIWHCWKWKKYTRKHNKQCSCGALSKRKLTVGAACEGHSSHPAWVTQVLLVMAYSIGKVFNYHSLRPTQMGLSLNVDMTREHFMNQFWFLNLLKDTAILEILRGLYMIKIELGLKKR